MMKPFNDTFEKQELNLFKDKGIGLFKKMGIFNCGR